MDNESLDFHNLQHKRFSLLNKTSNSWFFRHILGRQLTHGGTVFNRETSGSKNVKVVMFFFLGTLVQSCYYAFTSCFKSIAEYY